MSRVRNKLTDPKIRNAKPGYHADGGNLYIQVTKSGARSWIYRYTFQQRRQDMGLGPYPAVSIAQARKLRDHHAEILHSGKNPMVERDSVQSATFGQMTMDAFETRRASLKDDGEAGRWMSPLKVHVLPSLKDRDITTITQNDITNLLKPIWRTKTSAAEKALQRIGIIIRYAEAAGFDVDPRVVVKAKHLLGDQGHVVENIPAMPWRDVPEFYASLSDSSGDMALKLLILTALRSAPVRMAHSEQIEGDIWTIPGHLMKGRKTKTVDFRVPLTDEMKRVIGERNGLLFPGRESKPMSDMTLTAVLKRKGLIYRPHGFRSSFKDWAGENEVDWVVSEQILAHSIGSKASQAYARSDLLERRRVVLQSWADFVTGKTSKVVSISTGNNSSRGA